MSKPIVNLAVLAAVLNVCACASVARDEVLVAASQADLNEHSEIGLCTVVYHRSAIAADQDPNYKAPYDRERSEAFWNLQVSLGIVAQDAVPMDDDLIIAAPEEDPKIPSNERIEIDRACGQIASRYDETKHLEFEQ